MRYWDPPMTGNLLLILLIIVPVLKTVNTFTNNCVCLLFVLSVQSTVQTIVSNIAQAVTENNSIHASASICPQLSQLTGKHVLQLSQQIAARVQLLQHSGLLHLSLWLSYSVLQALTSIPAVTADSSILLQLLSNSGQYGRLQAVTSIPAVTADSSILLQLLSNSIEHGRLHAVTSIPAVTALQTAAYCCSCCLILDNMGDFKLSRKSQLSLETAAYCCSYCQIFDSMGDRLAPSLTVASRRRRQYLKVLKKSWRVRHENFFSPK